VDAFAAAQQRAFATLAERAPAVHAALTTGAGPLAASAPTVLGASGFVLDALCRDPALWEQLCERAAGPLAGEPLPLPQLEAFAVTQEDSCLAALRRWRRAEYARIAWRDLAGSDSLDETLAALSRAADLAVCSALAFAVRALAGRYGQPRSQHGVAQPLVIVAMGKLGGAELNFSSDIDLVLLYPEDGATDGPEAIANQEYFTRLAQRLVRLLAAQTADGFVFRVDLRLRPFGESGPVVSSAAALEDYLLIHGRDWERYAWVKARALTGQGVYAQLFRTMIGPFVYRRYLDFGVFESLREMKALIEREVARRDLAPNIKLGDGGIREIEFIVQAFQLIRGGQDQRLQGTSLRRALPLLASAKMLPAQAVAELDAAYVFLRRLENRLQMRADLQVHQVPEDPEERAILAASMRCADFAQLALELSAHRSRVAAHFRAIVFGARSPSSPATAVRAAAGGPDSSSAPPAAPSPLAGGDIAALRACLAGMAFQDAPAAAQLLLDFHHGAGVQRLDGIGARRLGELLPVLVRDAAATATPLAALRRLLRVLEAIGGRSAYFALLLHSLAARHRLVELSSHGDFLIEQIATYPLLLDELIDERLLDAPPDRAALAAELEQRMAGVDQDDEERLVERLRHFQRAALFRLAVADLLTDLPVMQVSDRLTELAELIIERALALTWQQLTPTLGTPLCGEGAARRPVRVCVVGYGKLGGMELGYASDLDLVFLHDSGGARQETEGARSIDNQVFFVRFAQRLVHLLTMHSAAGRLYEVDMRLRPSGKGGMLITSIEAFAEYQRRDAWTWEHQALLHARAVAGASALRARFEDVRMDILTHHVRRATLRAEVRSMRDRQRRELSRVREDSVDLKQDPGGIGDIEFLAQYWALLWAGRYPPVAMFADAIRQLESVASADLVPQGRIDVLTGAYRAYRSRLHHRALDGLGAVVPAQEFVTERATVSAIWNEVMGEEQGRPDPA
jgi:glutamate-ammonia-ligase adenylyltransferase